ncbi:hypothetical protein [Neisseria meningitidis]|nr:hypothetical protein [Neisseria meningitidis]
MPPNGMEAETMVGLASETMVGWASTHRFRRHPRAVIPAQAGIQP